MPSSSTFANSRLLHITVPLDVVLQVTGERRVIRHIEEWRDSVPVGTSVPIVDLLDYSSSDFSRDNPPVDVVLAFLFDRVSPVVNGVEGDAATTPRCIRRTL